MSEPEDLARDPVPAGRRWLFRLLALLLAVVVVELGSFLLLSIASGKIVTYGDLRARQGSRQHSEAVDVGERKDEVALLTEHRMRQVPPLHPYTGYVADPETTWLAKIPGFSSQAANLGFPYNRNDLFWEPSDQRLVIATFGGSFGGSLGAKVKILQPAFERVERWRDKELVFINFGFGGYKQPQQLMALNYMLFLRVHIDVVISVDGFNEIALPPVVNVPMGYFAHYPRGWILQVDDLDQNLRLLVGELSYRLDRRARLARAFAASPWRYSFAAGLVWTALDARATDRISDTELAIQEARSGEMSYQAQGPEWPFADEDELYTELVTAWKQAAIQMHALCRQLGIEYYHFLQPNQYLPESKPMGARERKNAYDPEHPYRAAVEKGYPQLIAAGDELLTAGVPFFDLTQVFADHQQPLYNDTCCHVTDEGYRIVAEAVAEAIHGMDSQS